MCVEVLLNRLLEDVLRAGRVVSSLNQFKRGILTFLAVLRLFGSIDMSTQWKWTH